MNNKLKKMLIIMIGTLMILATIIAAKAETVYQENANNTATYLDGYQWSPYYPDGGVGDATGIYDGNWSSFSTPDIAVGGAYLNYTKPANITSILWQVKDQDGIINLTIPSECDYSNTIQLWVESDDNVNQDTRWYCYNSTSWELLRTANNISNYPERIYEEAIYWAITEAGCSIDSDCGSCMKCDAGTCVFQNTSEDLKNECSEYLSSCLNLYTQNGPNGYCNGAGACDNSSNLHNVSAGNVCIDSMDAQPDATHNCGIWNNCITGNTNANQYYIGFAGDGTSTCSDTDWQPAGSVWNATAGYQINVTEHAPTCQEAEIPNLYAPELIVRITPQIPYVDETLVCVSNITDADNDTVFTSRIWYINHNKNKILNYTGDTLITDVDVTFNDSTTYKIKNNDYVTCEVTATDGLFNTTANDTVKMYSRPGGGSYVPPEARAEVVTPSNETNQTIGQAISQRITSIVNSLPVPTATKANQAAVLIVVAAVGGWLLLGKGAGSLTRRRKRR